MSKQNGDSIMMGSSIALLQERFRQLQRVKERRKEQQQLIKGYSSEQEASAMYSKPENLVMQSEMNFPSTSRPAYQDDVLYQGLNAKSFPADASGNNDIVNRARTTRSFENPDVDTSLHL